MLYFIFNMEKGVKLTKVLFLMVNLCILPAAVSGASKLAFLTQTFPNTHCSLNDAILFKHGFTIAKCIEECEAHKMCKSVNYNRFNALCVLRSDVTITNSVSRSNNCFAIDMNTSELTSSNGCSDRPCDEFFICKPQFDSMKYSCIIAYCSSRPYKQNAVLNSNTPTTIGHTNSYVCKDGFTAFGNATIACKTDGNWTDTYFICYPNCPAVPMKTNAVVSSRSAYRLTVNTTVTYSCSVGYYNLSNPQIICNETGDWSSFECMPHCSMPSVANSQIQIGFETPFVNDSMVTFSCISTHYAYPYGSQPAAICTKTGDWSYNNVQCYKYCGTPPDAWYVGFRYRPLPPFTVDSTAVYYCIPFGRDKTKTCSKNGIWEGHIECCAITCDTLN